MTIDVGAKLWIRCVRATLSVSAIAFLAACINDTPYGDSYSHIVLEVRGPGYVTMDTELSGELLCTAEDLCGYGNELEAEEVILVVATPDEGHEFYGWTRNSGPFKWNDDLAQGANPLYLPADGDYWITAVFR